MTVVKPAEDKLEPPRAGSSIRWRIVAAELLGTALIMVVYFLLRGIRPPDVDESVSRSLQLIRFE
ncbi:MAG: hypothetical protein IH609_16340, partial [Dehalococcoidia bacterium]|nr:hypothetical protein [Dehalococcoidia bacterium]